MRVNEVISRCRTDQPLVIHYDYDRRTISGSTYDIINKEEFRLNCIGDLIVTKIYTFKSDLVLKAVKV